MVDARAEWDHYHPHILDSIWCWGIVGLLAVLGIYIASAPADILSLQGIFFISIM
jgi:hypothetical protein